MTKGMRRLGMTAGVRSLGITAALPLQRHVGTERIGLERVAGHRVGTGARAAAHCTELAHAALALQATAVSQRTEELVVAIHVDEVVGTHVARAPWKEARGVDVAAMADEHEAVAVVDALCGASDAVTEAEADS
jgi:hypothetical protein